jgi:hypothetical protein
MAGIFISYRRRDAISATGRVSDALSRHFRHETVFRDVTALHPGDDYVDTIEESINACDVLLVVIGPRWLSATDGTGQRRLDDPDDEHRIEIETAFKRGVRVIPVLVEGAQMPSQQDLPAALEPLARRHAVAMADDHHWDYDLQRLIGAIETEIQARERKRQIAAPNDARTVGYLIALGWLVGAAIGEAGGFYGRVLLWPLLLSTSWAYGGAVAAAVTGLAVTGLAVSGLTVTSGVRAWGRLCAIVVVAGFGSWLLDAVIFSAIRNRYAALLQSFGEVLGSKDAPGEVLKYVNAIVCAVVVGMFVVWAAGRGRRLTGRLVLALALGGALGVAGEGMLKVALDHLPWMADESWKPFKDRARLTTWLVAGAGLILWWLTHRPPQRTIAVPDPRATRLA